MTKIPPPPPAKGGKKQQTAGAWESHTIEALTRSGSPIEIPVRRFAGPTRAGVPAVDPTYVFRAHLLRELAWAVWPHDAGAWTPHLLVGPKGCGKTSLVMQVAARCNVRVHRINLHVGTTTRHLKGRVGASGGSTVFVPGVATRAMEDGDWLLLDELSGATPPVALALFPILEPAGEVILEDAQPPRYVARSPDFRLFGTDNVIGADQEDARFAYGGTNPEVNEALLDRFGSTSQVGYLPEAQEYDLLMSKVPELNKTVAEGIIRVAKNVRESDVGIAFSTRMIVEWGRRFAAGRAIPGGVKPYSDKLDVLKCAKPAFLTRMRSKMERDAVVEIIARVIKIDLADAKEVI